MQVARIFAGVYLGTTAVFFSLQTRIIFPGASSQGQPFAEIHPRRGTELITLKTKSGERVVRFCTARALLSDGRPDPSAAMRRTLDLLRAWQRHVDFLRISQLEQFRRLGMNVLIPEYVGYGMSSGRPSEHGCQATALAAYDYLVDERKISPGQIIAAGWSLGGAVAIDLAGERRARAD